MSETYAIKLIVADHGPHLCGLVLNKPCGI